MACVACLLLRKTFFFIKTIMVLKPKFCLPFMDLLGEKLHSSSCEAVKGQVLQEQDLPFLLFFFFSQGMKFSDFRLVFNSYTI